jgi:4-aminobutyrate aminotransferase-like enzyme
MPNIRDIEISVECSVSHLTFFILWTMSEPHPILGTLISDPPHIERGWQNYLIGTDGRAYLDVVNNVTVVGHANVAVRKVCF